MESVPPKPEKRQWRWVLVVCFIVVGVAAWVILASDKIEMGDAGYLRKVRYDRTVGAFDGIIKHLPGPLRKSLGLVRDAASDRAYHQARALYTNGAISFIRVYLTNIPSSFSNSGTLLPEAGIFDRVFRAAPDKAYPPEPLHLDDYDGNLAVEFLCRTKDVPSYQAAFGVSNSVELYMKPYEAGRGDEVRMSPEGREEANSIGGTADR